MDVVRDMMGVLSEQRTCGQNEKKSAQLTGGAVEKIETNRTVHTYFLYLNYVGVVCNKS